MAAPRSSKRKQKAVLDIKSSTGAKKRKALTDRSNTVEKEPKKSKGNTKQKGPQRSSRRKTREVGSVCDVYVQEKKDRSGTLHLATYDTDTGGYIFTPKGKKTPIAFDGRRHKLVEKTPHPKESLKVKKTRKQCIKERLMAGFDAESDDEEDSVVSEKKPRTAPALPTRRNAKRKAAKIDSKQSGTESEEESVVTDNKPPIPSFRASSVSKEASSDDDSTVVTGRVRSKSIDSDDTESDEDNSEEPKKGGGKRRAASRAPKKSPTVKAKRRAATRAPKTYVDSDDESVLEDIEKAGGESSKSVFASSQHVSKKYIDSSFGQGGDWRMSCAIDY